MYLVYTSAIGLLSLFYNYVFRPGRDTQDLTCSLTLSFPKWEGRWLRRRCFNFNLDSPRLHSHVVNVVLTRPLTHSELVYAANGATILECAACDEHRIDPARYPICIDSGASVSITPNPTDFVNGIHPTTLVDLKGLEGLTRVHGEGIVEWRVVDLFNTVRVIRTKAYFVPGVTIRLFSPQTYFKEGNSGSYYMSHDGSTLTLHDGTALVFP